MGKKHNRNTNKYSRKNQREKERLRSFRVSKKERLKQEKKESTLKMKNDMENFQKQLLQFGLKIKIVKGDGNCLFRSFSDQLDGNENNHVKYRTLIVFFEQL